MDILTHTFSGFACGTVAASLYKGSLSDKACIVLAGSTGGALPDLDAVSLWTGFDRYFGIIISGLPSGREIYFGKYWYSHHGFMHSLAALIFFGVIFTLLRICSRPAGSVFSGYHLYSMLGFSSGYLMHLLEDLPTPSGTWGGINFLWPSSKYYGGTGEIWWWNNYDIFLIVINVCIINAILLLLPIQFNKIKRILPFCVLLGGISLSVIQIKSGNYNYNLATFDQKEQISLEKQKMILGNRLFEVMRLFDKAVMVNF
jgi:inner membrane protein